MHSKAELVQWPSIVVQLTRDVGPMTMIPAIFLETDCLSRVLGPYVKVLVLLGVTT